MIVMYMIMDNLFVFMRMHSVLNAKWHLCWLKIETLVLDVLPVHFVALGWCHISYFRTLLFPLSSLFCYLCLFISCLPFCLSFVFSSFLPSGGLFPPEVRYVGAVKGAPNYVLAKCTSILEARGQARSLTPADRDAITERMTSSCCPLLLCSVILFCSIRFSLIWWLFVWSRSCPSCFLSWFPFFLCRWFCPVPRSHFSFDFFLDHKKSSSFLLFSCSA